MPFQSVERFLQWLEVLIRAHGWFTLAGFTAGSLFVGLILGYFSYRRYRRVQRIAALAEERDLSDIQVDTLTTSVHISRSDRARRQSRGFALQAPGARGQVAITETVHIEGDVLTYRFPENDLGQPEGITFPSRATWIAGDPPVVSVTIAIVPVTVESAGMWYPAIVDTKTGLTHPRSHSRRRKYWQHGYRNLYVGDFVTEGDPLGTITNGKGVHSTHLISAPAPGFILQFGTLQFTPVAAHACVMLLGTPHDLRELTYHGDYAGYLLPPSDKAVHFVGRTVEAGTVLGTVSFLYGSIQEPVVAPVRLRIVRQHVNYGDTVQYRQPLFSYIPF